MKTALNLDQFTGTEHYYKYMMGIKLTDGVMYLATEAKCFWFLDIIASYQVESVETHMVRAEEFQTWHLKKCGNAWLVTATDGNEREIARQVVEYTDFEHDCAEVWFTDGVMLLPSEY